MNEMRWIVATSLRYRYLVVFVAAILMIFGVGQIRNMPVDVFPEFAPPRVEIQTPCLGLSSAEVESLVTIPLEEAMKGLPGLDIMRSKSVEQLSSIVLIFEGGTDLMNARQLVQERMALATATLPTWAAPPVMMPPLSSTARTMKIGISSDKLSVIDLSMITYWTIRERLLRVPGVANVAIWGEQIQMPQVQVEPEKLAKYGVTLEDILQTTSDSLDSGLIQYSEGSTIGTGGFLETPNQRIAIRNVMPVKGASDMESIAIDDVKKEDGSPLRLSDVAKLVEGTWPMIGDAVINDGPGLLLIIEKFPWGNSLEVTKGVEAAIEEMRPGLADIDIDTTIFRPATFIEVALDNLLGSLWQGALLVVIILILFLWDWRVALISATIIPLTVVITMLVLSYFGTTINVMVLAGLVIAIGAVVDDAIVDVENVVRRLRQHRRAGSNLPTAQIVLDSSVEVRNAIVNASLIEMTALLPVFFMEGLSGAFFQPLAQAYVVATLVSPLVALTVTPALVLILLQNAPIREHVSPIIPWLHRIYDRMLGGTLRAPRLSYLSTVALLAIGVVIYPLLGQSLLPSFKERDFLMHWLTKPGTSHPEMVRISTLACKDLRTIEGVRNCGTHIGQALLMDEVYGIYFAEHWISVDPNVDYDATLAKVQALVDSYPGLYHDVQTYLKERIREVLTGTSHPVVIRIYGEDLDVLRAKAKEVEEQLTQIEGLRDVHVEFLLDIPQIQIEVDLAKARKVGLKPGDVRRTAAYLMAGEEAGDIHNAHLTYDVNVWTTPENRHSMTSIYNMPIDTPSGKQVKLQDVANISIEPVPNAINREGQARRISIEADLKDGFDLAAVMKQVDAGIATVEFPLGYHPEVLGDYAERQGATQRIYWAGLAAILVIYFLLRVSLGNWRLATMSFISLPMAMVGGVLAAYLISGGVISLGSIVGFLTILGVAARNGIMLISHYQHLEDEEGEPFGLSLVIRGARERIAPIMMTALTAGLALVPLVIAGNIPGHEIEHPMAIVILGGLVTSTLVNLFIVPSLYLLLGNRHKPNTPTAPVTAA
ncbi:MAG: efflux RND transporter permease subunit [Caldilineaceae bacterium]